MLWSILPLIRVLTTFPHHPYHGITIATHTNWLAHLQRLVEVRHHRESSRESYIALISTTFFIDNRMDARRIQERFGYDQFGQWLIKVLHFSFRYKLDRQPSVLSIVIAFFFIFCLFLYSLLSWYWMYRAKVLECFKEVQSIIQFLKHIHMIVVKDLFL